MLFIDSKDEINIFLRKFLCKGIKEYRPYVKLGHPWAKLYSTKVIKRNKVYFPAGLHRTEDGIFNMYAAYFSQRICFINEPLYNYRVLDASISHKYYPQIVENTERDFYEVRKFADYYMNQDIIFAKGIDVRVTTWFYKYLTYKFFNKVYLKEYGYFKARGEIEHLLGREPYISAYKNVDLKLMNLKEKIFVLCMKCRLIDIAFLLVKIREIVKHAGQR